MAETFHNDINKVADMLYMSKEAFLESYSYLTEDDFYETMRNLLFNNFSYEEREEYKGWLIEEGYQDFAEKVL